MTATSAARARPPRASVPAFGGWEVAGGAGAAAPDYSLDFTNIRAARMQQRRKALSWSSFVGNAAVAVETPGCGGSGVEDEKPRQWSSAATSDADDDDDDDVAATSSAACVAPTTTASRSSPAAPLPR